MTCTQSQFEIRTPDVLPTPLLVSGTKAIVFKLTFECDTFGCPCEVSLFDTPSGSVVTEIFISSNSVDVRLLFHEGISIFGPLVMTVRAPKVTRLVCVRTLRVSSSGYDILVSPENFITDCGTTIEFESSYLGEPYEGRFRISYRNGDEFVPIYNSYINFQKI